MRISNLLLIPSLQENESLRAYMYKTAQANFFPRMFAGSAETLGLANEFLTLIEGRDDVIGKMLRFRLAPASSSGNKTYLFLVGCDELYASCVRISARSVCPLCLSESPWSRGEWELKAYTTCHVHRVKLVDECDQCAKKLTWDRTDLLRCYCGQSLCSVPTEVAAEWEQKWAEQVHRSFCKSISFGLGFDPSVLPGNRLSVAKLLLMADVIRVVLTPRKLPQCQIMDGPFQLIARLLADPVYCFHVWETIFFHAARDPMLLVEKLRPGQSNDELVQNYFALANELPLPLGVFPTLQAETQNRFVAPSRESAREAFLAHIADLKKRYGKQTYGTLDPFEKNLAVLRFDQ